MFHRVCGALVVRGASEKNGRAIILVPEPEATHRHGDPQGPPRKPPALGSVEPQALGPGKPWGGPEEG